MTDGEPSGTEQPSATSTRDGALSISIGGYDLSAKTALLLGAGAILLRAPAMLSSYLVGSLILALIVAMFAISVDLLWGYTGILTFGHAVFYGFGAYVVAKLTTEMAFPAVGYVGILAAVAIPGVAGLVIAGALFYRGIDEEYFTILTLAIAIMANQIAISWVDVTGGFNGIRGVPILELGIPGVATTPATGTTFYYLAVVALLGTYLVSRRIVRSPFGTVLVGINSNEVKATSLGYDVTLYKTLVFGLSAAIAGFAGGMYATYSGFVSPPLLGFLLSTEVLIWVLVGGRGTLIGPIIGATFLTLLENMLSGAFLQTWTLIIGIILILIVLIFPQGIVGILDILGDRLRRRVGGSSE